MVTLGHMWLGSALCILVWVLAFVGVSGLWRALQCPSSISDPCIVQVTFSLLGEEWQRAELALFIVMGWSVLPSVKYIAECLDPSGLALLVLGGVFYTSGMYHT